MEKLAIDFLGQQSGPLAILIGVIAALIWLSVKLKKAVSTVWPFIRKLVTVVEDLFGTEARPGVDARPGLMTRMAASEAADVAITTTLNQHSKALLELQPNHGGSMKDVLNAALRQITEQGERLGGLETKLTQHIADQKTAVTNAEVASMGAREAVVGAQAAVVAAGAAVVAATRDRSDLASQVTPQVHVNISTEPSP